MARYRFVDHWYIQAPIEQVFEHIADPGTYPQWWPVYPKVEMHPGPQPAEVGNQANLTVRSPLGYQLNLLTETTESDPPRWLNTRSQGDLQGTGTWEFAQEEDGTTHVTWTWIVESHHPLLNVLEPIAKPLFEWSHNYVSGKGHRGLKGLLEEEPEEPLEEPRWSRRGARHVWVSLLVAGGGMGAALLFFLLWRRQVLNRNQQNPQRIFKR
jgi:uncharacterized protein YndB with AHSA1/START domain